MRASDLERDTSSRLDGPSANVTREPTEQPASGAECAPGSLPVAGLGISEVTLVEVTLLGDLVRILSANEEHQRALLEQEKLANTQRAAALVEAQRHQAALLEQQRVLTASTIRSELRAYNAMSTRWKPLPLMNGEPFPVDVEFPTNIWSLKSMTEEQVRRVAAAYGIDGEQCDAAHTRDNIALFVTGQQIGRRC